MPRPKRAARKRRITELYIRKLKADPAGSFLVWDTLQRGLAIRLQPTGAKAILITGHGDIAMAVSAMKAGAIDFIEKPFEASTLLASVEAALRWRAADADPQAVEAAKKGLGSLTSREHEVLDQLVAGKSSKEVAAKLGISPRTVEFHRAHIMDKTGFQETALAVDLRAK